jgi:prevent-host-death family protein
MKTIKVADFKRHLSRYLRLVRSGQRLVVADRDTPVASVIPWEGAEESAWERLEREGTLRLGSQQWGDLKISPLPKAIDIQSVLDEVRGE